MSGVIARTALAFAALSLSGCSAMFKEPPGITYAKSVEQLGITPVYPPRESLQVGDVYAVEFDARRDRHGLRSAFIAPVDLSREITAYLGTRYKLEETQAEVVVEEEGALKLKKWQQDLPEDSGMRPAMLKFSTLPVTGLPRIEVDSGVSIGVGGQPTGLFAAFGFAAAKTLKMSLQYNEVTTYEVPPPVGFRRLEAYCDTVDEDNCESDDLAYWVNQKYQLGSANGDRVEEAGVLIITKVYLARQVTYTFNDTSVAALAAASESAKDKTPPLVNQEQVDTLVDAETPDPKALSALASIIKSAGDYVSKTKEGDANITIAGLSRQSIALTEVFPRPVVIGYECVSMVGRPPTED